MCARVVTSGALSIRCVIIDRPHPHLTSRNLHENSINVWNSLSCWPKMSNLGQRYFQLTFPKLLKVRYLTVDDVVSANSMNFRNVFASHWKCHQHPPVWFASSSNHRFSMWIMMESKSLNRKADAKQMTVMVKCWRVVDDVECCRQWWLRLVQFHWNPVRDTFAGVRVSDEPSARQPARFLIGNWSLFLAVAYINSRTIVDWQAINQATGALCARTHRNGCKVFYFLLSVVYRLRLTDEDRINSTKWSL